MDSRGYYNGGGGGGGGGYFPPGNRGYSGQMTNNGGGQPGGMYGNNNNNNMDPNAGMYDPSMADPYYYDSQGMQMSMGNNGGDMGGMGGDGEYYDDGMMAGGMGGLNMNNNAYGGDGSQDMYPNEAPIPMMGASGVGVGAGADFDTDMGWGEHSVMYPIEQASSTVLQFDDAVEVLWCGDSSGRITAHQLLSGGYEMDRYASFKVSESPVLDLLPMYESIASVTEKSIRVHSRGGMPLATFDMLGDNSEFTFTCGNVVKYATESGHIPLSILAGTSTQYVNIYDAATASALGSFDTECPTVRMSSNAYYVAVAGSDGKVRLMDPRLRSPHVIHTLAAHTGSITDMVLDTDGFSLATCGMNGRALNPYDPKSPIIYKPDTSIRLFDLRMPQSPSQISMLSVVPAFLKLMTSALDLLIGVNSSIDAMPPPSVLMASADGLLQFAFPPDETSIESTLSPVVMTPAVDLPVGPLSCIASSSSGRLIALGTESGAVVTMHMQHIVTEEEEALWSEGGDPANPIVAGNPLPPAVNMAITSLNRPPAQPPVAKYVDVDAAVVSTSYVLTRYPVNNPVVPASFFPSTPKYVERKMKFQNSRKLSDAVASAAVMQGFMGHLPNPGFPANNMIYGNSRKDAYQAGDIRVVAAAAARAGGAGGDNDDGGYMSAHAVIPQRYRRVQSHRGKSRMKQFNYLEFNTIGSSIVGLENAIERPWINPIVQLLFSFTDICVYALESQVRSFHHTQSLNSLWCELGLLFHSMLVVRDTINAQDAKAVASASNFHTVFFHCPAAAAVGLLQDALKSRGGEDVLAGGGPMGSLQGGGNDSAIRTGAGAAPSTSGSNALSSDSYAIRLQQSLQIFIRFLFQQLSKEADLEGKFNASKGVTWKHGSSTLFADNPDANPRDAIHSHDVVDSLFGITLRSSTTFLQSGTVDIGATHRVSTLDLAYPAVATSSAAALNIKAATNPDANTKALANFLENAKVQYPHTVSLRSKWVANNPSSKPSFCAVFWNTIVKETFMRGWCSASEAYEPFRQIKTVDVASMPDFVALLCGDTLPPSNAPAIASADAAASASAAADPVVTIAREKTAIGGLWRGPNCFQTGPWMPVELEIFKVPSSSIGIDGSASGSPQKAGKANQSSTPAAPGEMIFVSERIQKVHPHHHSASSDASTASGSGGNKLDESHEWLIFNGACYITSSVPASVLFRSAMSSDSQIEKSTGDALSYEIYSIVSHVDSSNSGTHSGSNDMPSHAVVHMRNSAYNQSKPSSDTATASTSGNKGSNNWVLVNDFNIAPSDDADATTFTTWRHPDAIFLSKVRHASSSSDANTSNAIARLNVPGTIRARPVIPESVMSLPSLSSKSSVRPPLISQLPKLDYITRLIEAPVPAELLDARFVAFDAEFVTVEVDEVQLDTRGQQVIGREGRQVIARISLLAEAPLNLDVQNANNADTASGSKSTGKKNNKATDVNSREQGAWKSEIKLPVINLPMNSQTRHIQPNPNISEEARKELLEANVIPLTLLCDDYVLPSEPVVDYVTRFSGLTADDLNPAISSHALIPHRSAILKLRSYRDRNCIFVGHGLQKDFETANIHVPPEQIRDTVELWRLPGQRKVSLRFLAAFLLGADIQDEIHDSIEDAKTAFALYLLYVKANALYGQEGIQAILHDLYDFGHANSWTLGLERIKN